MQTTGRASPLERDSQSPLPSSSVAEAKNRSIILKQEDFVKKKEEPAKKEEVVKKKEEEVVVKKEKMEKTSSRSGLSCLRPNTLDEDTEAFTRCTIFHSCIALFLFWLIKTDAKENFMEFDKLTGVLREERQHSVLEEEV